MRQIFHKHQGQRFVLGIMIDFQQMTVLSSGQLEVVGTATPLNIHQVHEYATVTSQFF
jgi:hypothetical protein